VLLLSPNSWTFPQCQRIYYYFNIILFYNLVMRHEYILGFLCIYFMIFMFSQKPEINTQNSTAIILLHFHKSLQYLSRKGLYICNILSWLVTIYTLFISAADFKTAYMKFILQVVHIWYYVWLKAAGNNERSIIGLISLLSPTKYAHIIKTLL
jgi:hypothetical protein